MRQDIFLLLGSNLGKRDEFLIQAVKELNRMLEPVERTSSVFKTQSWGRTELPEYLNQVVFFKSDKTAEEILRTIQRIEIKLGRTREEKWGSRTIDIDILFYGNEIINTPDLTIPHRLFEKRRFALEPMLELAPDFVHPVLNKTIAVLATELEDDLSVEKI